MSSQLSTALASSNKFLRMAMHNDLRQNKEYIGDTYKVGNGEYKVFRVTEKLDTQGEQIILVVGFRLKIIGYNHLLHYLFQRVCMLTTPFWSGIEGFRIKLWMVDKITKNYIGIYDWRGKEEAKHYIDYLLPVLKFFSVKGTVWAEQIYGEKFEEYLADHKLNVERFETLKEAGR